MADDLFAVDGVDALYGLEPAGFVAARDALAKQLKVEGDKDSAAAVKKLAKPSVVAWAVNQVARRDPAALDALVAAGAKVRDAQADAVRGADASALRTASRQRRDLLQNLADTATGLAGATHRDEILATLDSASLDDDLAAVLRTGRLTKALEPVSGFGLTGMPEPPARAAAETSKEDRPRDETTRRRATEGLVSAEELLAAADAPRTPSR